jgi:hypothetical protein
MDWKTRVQFPAGAVKGLSLFHHVQTSSGADPTSCPVGIGAPFLGKWQKWPGHEAIDSSPSSVEVKNFGAIPPLPYTSSWCGA